MIKLLFSNELLLEALRNPESASAGFIKRCATEDGLQAWVLANAIQFCAEAGVKAGKINGILEGIAQIPVNARLNEQALASPAGFQVGLQAAAAVMFKLSHVVGLESAPEVDGVTFIDVAEAIMLDPAMAGDRGDFLNLNLALHPIFNRMDGWFMEIIQNTAFAGGNHVAEFEKEFAEFCNVSHAVGVSNGTDALLFALLAMGIKPGDEIITVPNTFIATTEAISQAGATPVFVDVKPDSYLMDPTLIETKISEKTRAIIPVHLYGQIADMDTIMAVAEKHDLLVLEDACQAHGALYNGKRAGTIGHAGCFSMYPGKNLGAFGEAGCVVTADSDIAETVNCLREHGQNRKYYHRMEGYNGRMDNLQAAVLRAKLPSLDGWNNNRRRVAGLYKRELDGVAGITLPTIRDESGHVFHLFVVLVSDPNGLADYLKDKQIFVGFHYPVPLHLQDAYQGRGEGVGSYPVSEACAEQLISLPMFPELTESQVVRVCDEIKRFLAQ